MMTRLAWVRTPDGRLCLEETLSGAQIVAMMRRRALTIRAVAKYMNITQARVREVRRGGVRGRAHVTDWMEALSVLGGIVADVHCRRSPAAATGGFVTCTTGGESQVQT